MTEQQDLLEFLTQTPPFDRLDQQALRQAVAGMQEMYLCQANVADIFQDPEPRLYLVRSGAFDLYTRDGQHVERLEPGDLFGFPSLLSGRPITNELDVIADGIVGIWSRDLFNQLRQQCQGFEQYFVNAHARRLLTEQQEPRQPDWTSKTIASVLRKEPVTIASRASIQAAAQLMAGERVSSLLVVDDGQLRGIVTDRDLRTRVVAKALAVNNAVAAIMTPMPATVYANQSLFDALTHMSHDNVHHLPVLDEQERPVGVITATDLTRQQRSEPVFLMNALFKASNRAELVHEAGKIPDYLRTFAGRIQDTGALGRLLSSLTDGMTRKLIQLYEQQYGTAPVAYVWLAFGSQARGDQTLGSDQDNGLLLADEATPAQRDYFAGLAEYVCQGLADCGIRLCPGDVMAKNETWRKSRLEWRDQFSRWIRSPTPDAIMHSMIFFDSRAVAGNTKLYRQHREEVAQLANRDMFLGAIARHIGELSVPLGLFNRFRTRSEGNSDYIDIKQQGIAILNDIVRLYALAAELTVPATPARLLALQQISQLTSSDNQNLLEAWQFLNQLRFQVQLQSQPGLPANAVDPEQLSTLQRRQLKAAFRVVKEAQQGVAFKFGRHL